MITDEQIKKYHTLSAAIAKAGGWNWEPSRPTMPRGEDATYAHQHQTLSDANGRTFTLAFDRWGNEGRIVIYGDYPRSANGQPVYYDKTPEITISQDRKPEAAAADIKRRFYGEFVAEWQKRDGAARKEAVQIEWARMAAQMLMKQAGARFAGSTPFRTVAAVNQPNFEMYSDKVMGRISICGYSQTVTIERITSLDLETATEILTML